MGKTSWVNSFSTYAFAKINGESFVPNVHPTVQPTWYMRGRTIRSWCQSLRLPKQCGKNYRFWTFLPKLNWHDFKEGDQVGFHVNNLTPNWNDVTIFVSTRGDFNFILPSLQPPPPSLPLSLSLRGWENLSNSPLSSLLLWLSSSSYIWQLRDDSSLFLVSSFLLPQVSAVERMKDVNDFSSHTVHIWLNHL